MNYFLPFGFIKVLLFVINPCIPYSKFVGAESHAKFWSFYQNGIMLYYGPFSLLLIFFVKYIHYVDSIFFTAIVLRSKFWEITNFSDHKRVCTANSSHALQSSNPVCHKTWYVRWIWSTISCYLLAGGADLSWDTSTLSHAWSCDGIDSSGAPPISMSFQCRTWTLYQ